MKLHTPGVRRLRPHAPVGQKVVVQFVDDVPGVPQTRQRGVLNREFADCLRRNPGRFAVYPWPIKDPYDLRRRINEGSVRAFGPGFHAEVRNRIVYVRFVGEEIAI